MRIGTDPVFRIICSSLGGSFILVVLSVGGATAYGTLQKAGLPDVSGIPAASPVPYSSKSIAKGKATFLRLCAECHDEDGKALAQTLAPAADLTDPTRWKHGTGDAYLFRSIRDGAGTAMPVFGNQLKDEDIWDLVSFIRSIGPPSFQSGRQP
jgi:mono/diheme cytochrome c family protein